MFLLKTDKNHFNVLHNDQVTNGFVLSLNGCILLNVISFLLSVHTYPSVIHFVKSALFSRSFVEDTGALITTDNDVIVLKGIEKVSGLVLDLY